MDPTKSMTLMPEALTFLLTLVMVALVAEPPDRARFRFTLSAMIMQVCGKAIRSNWIRQAFNPSRKESAGTSQGGCALVLFRKAPSISRRGASSGRHACV
ncbi:MAG: hypothetical protein JST45_07940 [Bacteroidetes bacterium]|nr:hypothetical protein [Bacteroidota bacterium]